MKKIIFLFIMCILLTGCNDCEKELLQSVISPDGKNTINTYLNNCGATVDYFVTAELCDKNNKCKKIYDCYHENDSLVYWIDNENVFINNKKLNINKDKYDWRKDEDYYDKIFKLSSYGEQTKGYLKDYINNKNIELTSKEIYKIIEIIEEYDFSSADCDGQPLYEINIVGDKENTYRVEVNDKIVHIRNNQNEIILNRTDSEYIKKVINKYNNE